MLGLTALIAFVVGLAVVGSYFNPQDGMAVAGTIITASIIPAGIIKPMLGSEFNRLYNTPAGGGGGETEAQKAERLLLEKIKSQVGVDVAAFLKDNPEIKDLLAFKATITEIKGKLEAQLKPEEITALKESLNQALLEIKALKEPKVTGGPQKGSFAETLAKQKAKLDKFISEKSGNVAFEHVPATKATHTSTDITNRDDFFTWHEGGAIGEIPVRRTFMKQLFRNINTETEYIKYLDQNTKVRDAKNVALCGTTTHNTKLTWITRSINVEKVRDFTHICLDMMNDYAFVEGEIRRLLDSSLQDKIDDGLLLGDGISPNLHSVDEVASTFAADGGNPGGEEDYTQEVVSANLIDLIVVAGAQIRTFGKNNKWIPNYVLLNPRDLNSLKFLKDTQKNYLNRNQMFTNLWQDRAGNYYVDGMLLIENSLVPVNEFYIGDFRYGTVYKRAGFGVEFSYENRENFETETVTAKVYERLNLLIRNVDQNAFMHVADIEQAIFDISVPT